MGIFDATVSFTPVAKRYVNPRPILNIPSVVIKGLILNLVIISPLIVPNNSPNKRPLSKARKAFSSLTVINLAVSIEDTAKRDPTERSIPPVIMTIVWPIAIIPIVDILRRTLNKLSWVKKYGLSILIRMTITIRALNTFTSLI